jgi:hypothetical protein
MTYDPKKFDGFDRPDETPKTFAELNPPGYWSKSAGYFVPVCKAEREPPSGKITIMKAPTQCALWEKPELMDEPNRRDRFELLETFVELQLGYRRAAAAWRSCRAAKGAGAPSRAHVAVTAAPIVGENSIGIA